MDWFKSKWTSTGHVVFTWTYIQYLYIYTVYINYVSCKFHSPKNKTKQIWDWGILPNAIPWAICTCLQPTKSDAFKQTNKHINKQTNGFTKNTSRITNQCGSSSDIADHPMNRHSLCLRLKTGWYHGEWQFSKRDCHASSHTWTDQKHPTTIKYDAQWCRFLKASTAFTIICGVSSATRSLKFLQISTLDMCCKSPQFPKICAVQWRPAS